MDEYDYSLTQPHLQLFVNPLNDEPFIAEMEDTFGTLWEFKEHVSNWSFGVNRWRNYVYLRYRVRGKTNYLPWNPKEKVTLIEDHQKNYVVIGLREVDDHGKHKEHCHSIVINVHSPHAKFDLENLMTFLEGSQMESLNEEFENNKYAPWVDSTAKSNASRLRLIFQTLDRYALENVEPLPVVGRQSAQNMRPSETPPKLPTTLGALEGTTARPGQVRSTPKKRVAGTSSGTESTRKRKKSLPSGLGRGASSASALTSVSAGTLPASEPVPEYEKFAAIQKKFWDDHEDCFVNGMDTVSVPITQCIIASDQYVIRTLQRDIVDTVKNELIQLIDVKQRQKICLTPVDSNKRLLKQKPEKWDDIKDGLFMIINGQHSIIASQELQLGGCGVDRKVKLQNWDAFIVWSLDHAKLRNISKFYNITNHLDHARPTWGNQIIACRNIWITYRRATDELNDSATRKNNSVYNVNKYKVTISFSEISSSR
jgi:hypothetical protein